MSLYSPNQEKTPNTDRIYLINPTVEEFTTSYLTDDNKEVKVVFAPLETRDFERGVGETILNHLCNFVLNQSGFSYKTDPKKELADIRNKCIVYE